MQRLPLILTVLLLLVAATGGVLAEPPAHRPLVMVSFYPLQFFVERIAGSRVEVSCPVPTGEDPRSWIPDRTTLGRMQRADLVIAHGANYEAWLGLVSLASSRLVIATKALEADLIRFPNPTTHSHGPSGSHSHEGIDPHTWLDPRLAAREAEVIREALSRLVPDHRSELEAGYRGLQADLEALDVSLRRVSARLAGKTLLCSHPAYNYLGRTYGWDMVTRTLAPAQRPDPSELEPVKALQTNHPIRWVLWESPPAPEVVQEFEGIGIGSVLYSPCELPGPEEIKAGRDFLEVMRKNIAHLESATAGDGN